MCLTFGTERFCLHMWTMLNTFTCICIQFLTLLTQLTLFCMMLFITVQRNHKLYCLFFFFSFFCNIHYQLILPFSLEYTRSAIHIVDFLWLTSKTAVSSHDIFNAFNITASFKLSRLLVGSSSRINGASCRNALAIPILWLPPPDSVSPSSPIFVSYHPQVINVS